MFRGAIKSDTWLITLLRQHWRPERHSAVARAAAADADVNDDVYIVGTLPTWLGQAEILKLTRLGSSLAALACSCGDGCVTLLGTTGMPPGFWQGCHPGF